MTRSEAMRLALGGCLAMAAAMGIGRFVYTPILPMMTEALGWNRSDAGLVASANFLGYLIGALVAGFSIFSSAPRRWLFVSLVLSVATTAVMGATTSLLALAALRFVGGIASAFVIICASSLVLERLTRAGQSAFAAWHFAGVGTGIVLSAALVALIDRSHAGWIAAWLASGAMAGMLSALAAFLIPPASKFDPVATAVAATPPPAVRIAPMALAYGLVGFGYVITSTFIVSLVRQTPEVRPLEPWIWILFGLAAMPSVSFWQQLGTRFGITRVFAVACLVEAIGVGASVEWTTLAGIGTSAVLLGGTFMGLTALGLMAGRASGGARPQRIIGLMTASFGAGQMIGPLLAGYLADLTGSLRAPTLMAAAALVVAAASALLAARPASGR